MTNSEHSAHRQMTVLGPFILLAVLFLSALILSWRAWPDILVDFGRELYLPWRVSQGQVLYQDQAHLFGPLSVYYHAVLFRIFGTSYTIIIISNLGVFAILLYLLYSIWSQLSQLAAWINVAVTTAIFGFGQYVGIGNYNFLSPYSHEATHGLILTTFMIHQLGAYKDQIQRRSLGLAGFAFGLVLLTRTDLFLAALATVIGFFSLQIKDIKFKKREITDFIGAASVPIIIFAVFFSTKMPLYEAVLALLEPWRVLTISGVHQNAFYSTVTGFDNPVRNSINSLVEASGIIIFIWLLMWVARLSIEHQKWGQFGRIVWLIAVTITILVLMPYNIGRSLPILCTIVLIVLLKKRRHTGSVATKPTLWAIFSLVLLLRMPLQATFIHYGFYVALPATNLLIGSMIWIVPFWLERPTLRARMIARNLMLMAILVLTSALFAFSNKIYSMKNFKIGNEEDHFWAFDSKIDSRTAIVADTLNWLENNLHQDETFVAMPEGIMLNYLTRHANPTRYFNFMPPELAAYGETAIVEQLNSHYPDYVLIVHKDTVEYGYGFFGQDPTYGMSIMNWVNQNYRSICLIGDQPLTNEYFGIEIRIRNNHPTNPTPPCP